MSGTSSGRVIPYTPVNAGTGWLVQFDDEWFYAMNVPGRNGGFYLFSAATESYVYQGKALK